MKDVPRRLLAVLALFALVPLLPSCDWQVELRPELRSHLAEYEALIEEYEARFAAVGSDRPKFAKVSEAYSKEVKAWLSEWDTVAPNMSDEEGRAVKAQVDRLNKRATRMLTRG